MGHQPPASLTHPVGSTAAATALIDQLHIQFKGTFKRKPSVDLYVSVTFGTTEPDSCTPERKRHLRRLGITPPPPRQTPDIYSLTIRPSDPTDANQQWEAEWMLKAAEAADAATSSNRSTS